MLILRAGLQRFEYDRDQRRGRLFHTVGPSAVRGHGHSDVEAFVEAGPKSQAPEAREGGQEAWATEIGALARLSTPQGVEISVPSWALGIANVAQESFRDEQGSGERIVIVSRDTALGIEMRLSYFVYDDLDYVFAQCELKNTGRSPIRVEALSPWYIPTGRNRIRIGGGAQNWFWYQRGQRFAARTRSLFDYYEFLETPPRDPMPPLLSGWHGLFGDPAAGEYVVAGAVTREGPKAQVVLTVGGLAHNEETQLEIRCPIEKPLLEPGATAHSPEAAMRKFQGSPWRALVDFARVVVRRAHLEPRTSLPPVVWSSWYAYGSVIDEDKILHNARAIAAHRNVWPVDVIHMDYGWCLQGRFGDWEPETDRFPRGMKAVADDLRALGFLPGIWSRPAVVMKSSRIAREHPEWMVPTVQKRIGPYGDYFPSPDEPGVAEWYRALFRRFTKEWGYRYVKIEMLIDEWEKVYPGIREVCGPDVTILAAGFNLSSALGRADIERVGNDVHKRWDDPAANRRYVCGPVGIREACLSAILRSHENRLFWWIDADGIGLFPSPAARPGNPYPDADVDYEMQFYASVMALTGGAVGCWGAFDKIEPREDNLLSCIVPPYGEAAEVVDFFTPGGPQLLNLRIERPFGAWNVVGVLNWSERPSARKLTAAELGLEPTRAYHVFDFWNWRYLGRLAGEMPLPEQRGHQALVLAVRPDDGGLQLLSTSCHFTQGGVELSDVESSPERFEATLTRPKGPHTTRLAFWAPEQRTVECRTEGGTCEVRAMGSGCWEVLLDYDTAVRFRIWTVLGA